jgi:hypothetical protein
MSRDPRNFVNEKTTTVKWRVRAEKQALIQIDDITSESNESLKIPKRIGLMEMEILCLCVQTGSALAQGVLFFVSGSPDIFVVYPIAVWTELISEVVYLLIKISTVILHITLLPHFFF